MKRFCRFLLPALLISLASQSALAQQTLTIQGERVIHEFFGNYGHGIGLSGIVSFEFEVPPNQTDLNFTNFGLTSITLPAGLTNLETLNLGGGRMFISDEHISNYLTTFSLPAGLTNLKTLDISGNDLLSLTLPAGLTRLETLNLENNDLQFLTFPEGLASLKTLNLEGNNRLTSLTLPKGMMNLENLSIDGGNLKSLAFLDGLMNLKTLTISGGGLSSLTLPTGLANLETLRISGGNLKSLALPEGLTNLKTLYFPRGNSLRTLFVRQDLYDSIQAGNVSIERFEGTLTVYDPPVLNISRMEDGSLQITWNTGVLQSAADLFGEWRDLESATSPLRISFPKIEAMRFFRLHL